MLSEHKGTRTSKRRKSSGKEGKRLAWVSQDLLVKLKGKKEIQSVKARTGIQGSL